MKIRDFLSVQIERAYYPVIFRMRHPLGYKRLLAVYRESVDRLQSCCVDIPSVEKGWQPKLPLAIQIHVFYLDLISEFIADMQKIRIPYDLFISTDAEAKRKVIADELSSVPLSARKIYLDVFENRGRDVYPFLAQMHERFSKYGYIAHFHTKKSPYSGVGNFWRKTLMKSFFGKDGRFDGLLRFLEQNESFGLIIPMVPKSRVLRWGYAATKADSWNDTAVRCELEAVGVDASEFQLKNYEHSAGTMFIARTDAVWQIFSKAYVAADFPDECGQRKHTLQHVIELLWHPVCKANGYKLGVADSQV